MPVSMSEAGMSISCHTRATPEQCEPQLGRSCHALMFVRQRLAADMRHDASQHAGNERCIIVHMTRGEPEICEFQPTDQDAVRWLILVGLGGITQPR